MTGRFNKSNEADNTAYLCRYFLWGIKNKDKEKMKEIHVWEIAGKMPGSILKNRSDR